MARGAGRNGATRRALRRQANGPTLPFTSRVLRVQCRAAVLVRRFWGLPRQSGGPPLAYPVARVSLRPDPVHPGDRSGMAGADPTGRR